jgi:hypothetical protein
LPHPSPNYPTPSKSPNPNCLAPNNDDLGNIPALAIRNKYYTVNKPPLPERGGVLNCPEGYLKKKHVTEDEKA